MFSKLKMIGQSNRFIEATRRFLVVFAFAFWLGGFFFYASVVVPTGSRVLGSHTMQGFVTQQVTRWLNLISLPALLILLWNVIAAWPGGYRRLCVGLAATWVFVATVQLVLFPIHSRMDGLLNAQAHQISDAARFYATHRVYLILSAFQNTEL